MKTASWESSAIRWRRCVIHEAIHLILSLTFSPCLYLSRHGHTDATLGLKHKFKSNILIDLRPKTWRYSVYNCIKIAYPHVGVAGCLYSLYHDTENVCSVIFFTNRSKHLNFLKPKETLSIVSWLLVNLLIRCLTKYILWDTFWIFQIKKVSAFQCEDVLLLFVKYDSNL